MFTPDLTNCEREPIHIPGKIQEHGFLLAIDKGFIIQFCSENIADFLAVAAGTLLNQPASIIDSYLQREQSPGFIEQFINIAQTHKGFEPANPYPLMIDGKAFNLIICQSEAHFLVEFEPEISDLSIDLQRVIGSSLSAMLADANLASLLDKTALQIQKVIGYDRVMIYKFHEDGHGEVVAEVKNANLEPLMGLHYPASDIPKQARELYKINLTRLIADVNATPSAILTLEDLSPTALDLTHSSLRAVSPIHIQYLKNMGVASSFSVSLIHQGELWGLVACHNYTSRFINYKEREAAKLIGQVLSSALSFRQQEEDQNKKANLKSAVDTLTKQLLRYNNMEDALLSHQITLLDAVEASGAVFVFDNGIHCVGQTPGEDFVKQIVEWLNEKNGDTVYETNQLSDVYPQALSYKDIASGILAVRLSKELKEYIIWFRPEVINKVNWAGNPDKPVEISEQGIMQISPRKSFETWSQQVSLTSLPWKNEDVRSALQLKDEVIFAVNRKASEIRLLNEKLKEAYGELDAFSYTISHDLKNPLTTIKSYSQLLNRNANLDPKSKKMVDGILSGTQKMQGMIEEVLNYSRVGQIGSTSRQVDVGVLLDDLKQQLTIAYTGQDVAIAIGETPPIHGDQTMIQQVFANLVGNAVKYSAKTTRPEIYISGSTTETCVEYHVKDNGIGIHPKDQGKIFDLFSRSDEVDDYEGTGVGLAIVKKIMDKHQGRIWVESEPGQGSTFFVAFKNI